MWHFKKNKLYDVIKTWKMDSSLGVEKVIIAVFSLIVSGSPLLSCYIQHV